MNDPKNLPTYSKEEVASILTRALDRQHEGGRISHDELLETAREIGVTTLEIEAAVTEEVKLRAERIVREEARDRAVKRLVRHVAAFSGATVIFVAVDVRFTGGVWWYWAAIAWAVAVAFHAASVLVPREAAAPAKPAAPPTPTRIEVRGAKMELRKPDAAASDGTRRRAGR
jgi:hypothetical protein